MSDYDKILNNWKKRRQKAVKLRKQGLSLAEIGEELGGITRQRVAQMIKAEVGK